MHLKAIAILLFTFITLGSAQAQSGFKCFTPKYCNPAGRMHKNCVDKFNHRQGVWLNYSKQGKLLSEISYIDNKIDGFRIYYNPKTGTIQSKEQFVAGLLNGEAEYYDEKGNLIKKMVYKEGIEVK